jgi:hypothetical protein
MLLQLQQHSILIGRKPVGFTEHYYTEWDDGLGKDKISFFIVMSVSSSQIPAAEIGKEAFQLLQDHFLHDLSGDPYDRFERALREINTMVNEKEKDLELKFIPNMHLMVGVIQKDQLFISQRGEAHGYLIRKRHLSCITEGLSDERNKEDLFQNIASGQLEVGDSLVFVTGPLIQYITPGDMAQLFSEFAVGEAGRQLKELLHNDLEDQLALLAFEVLEKMEEVTPVSVPAQALPIPSLGEFEEKQPGGFPLSSEARKDHMKHLKSSLSVLQGWAKHEDRWKFLDKIKHLPKKQMLALMLVVATVTVGGVFALQFSLGKQKLQDNMQAKLTSAEEGLKQAQTRGAFDKDEASVLLVNAETALKEVLESGYFGGKASELLDEVQEERDSLDNVFRVGDELKLLVDFDPLLGKGKIVSVAPSDSGLVVFTDHESYEVLIDQPQSAKELEATETLVASVAFPDRENVLVLSTGGLLEYEAGNAQLADNSDGTWKTGVDLATYGARVYVLDPANKQIWKYQRGTTAFGGAAAYLDPEKVDVSKAVSIAIDGSVWVLESDGTLLKLLSGVPVDYDVLRAPLISLEGAKAIYTELEMSQLYVLQAKENRVVVYTKSAKNNDLTYSSQYVLDDLKGTLQDFYVDKTRNVIVLVTDKALYELNFGTK